MSRSGRGGGRRGRDGAPAAGSRYLPGCRRSATGPPTPRCPSDRHRSAGWLPHGPTAAWPPRQVGERTVRQLGGAGDPGQHPDLVVQLHRRDVAAARDLVVRQYRHDRGVPALGLGEVPGLQVVEGPRGRLYAVPAGRNRFRVVAVDTERYALVLELGHHERARASNHQQVALGREFQEADQVTVLARGSGQIGLAGGGLVHEPRHVTGHGGTSGGHELVEPVGPVLAAQPEVMHLAGHQDPRDAPYEKAAPLQPDGRAVLFGLCGMLHTTGPWPGI